MLYRQNFMQMQMCSVVYTTVDDSRPQWYKYVSNRIENGCIADEKKTCFALINFSDQNLLNDHYTCNARVQTVSTYIFVSAQSADRCAGYMHKKSTTDDMLRDARHFLNRNSMFYAIRAGRLPENYMSYFLEKEMLVFFLYMCALPYIIKDMHNINEMYHQEIEGVYVNTLVTP